jgi:hypothetical protein
VETFLLDLVHSPRLFRRSPGFTVAAIAPQGTFSAGSPAKFAHWSRQIAVIEDAAAFKRQGRKGRNPLC